MFYGYTGNILRVNLSHNKIWVEHPNYSFYRKYLGGRAIALYYMLNEMDPGVEPFSEDNLLIFATSVIVGPNIPAINRYTVCSKSPLTNAQGESESAGFWGPELKKAGFDAIIIQGISIKPIYLWIKNNKVELKNASHLWGKSTGDTQDIIREELGDSKIRVALIGPAGENLVRYACILNDLSHANGRNGIGAVMGSKKLKAVAVRGTNNVEVYDEEKIKEISINYAKRSLSNPLAKDLRENGTIGSLDAYLSAGWLPTRNWKFAGHKINKKFCINYFNSKFLKKKSGCYGCPIACKRIVEVDEPKFKVNPIYGGPEYETAASFGSLCEVYDLKYTCKAHELCNKLGLDVISTGASIAFAMQCFENKLITKKDTNGIELIFGNGDAMLKMIKDIAWRRNIGNILAEGTQRASLKIGKKSVSFLRVVKKQELPMHDPRVKPGVAMQYAISDYGADHMKAGHDTMFNNNDSWGIKEGGPLGLYNGVPANSINLEKVWLFKRLDICWSLFDILGVCIFGWAPRGIGTMEELLSIVKAVTGWRTSWYELMQTGERSINMSHIYNLREGFTIKDDSIPDIFFRNFKGGPLDGQGAMNKKSFKEALRLRYEMMGWDPKTSIPFPGKLHDLQLSWLIDERKKFIKIHL